MKKIICLLLMTTLVFSAFMVSFATGEERGQTIRVLHNANLKRDHISNDINSKMTKQEFKMDTLKRLKKYPEKNRQYIDNIDQIVDEIFNDNKNLEGMLPIIVAVKSEWAEEPVCTKSTKMITYANAWLVEDNYQCPTPYTLTDTKRIEIEQTLSITGDTDIGEFLNVEVGLEKTVTQEATFSYEYTIPAWTVKARKPYIKWNKDKYEGVWRVYFKLETYPGAGDAIYTDYDKELIKEYSTYKANKNWERINEGKNVNATTPLPPEGSPV